MTQIWHWTSLELDHQQKAGGVEKHIQQTSASLKSRGYEVSWGLSPPEQWLRQHSNEPLFVHTHGDFLVNPLFIRKLRARRRIVWIHVCHGNTVARIIACREYFSLSGWRGALIDLIPAKWADAAVAVSHQALKETKRYFHLNIPSRVISNGVDPSVFQPLKKVLANPRLIFVGRDGDRVKNTEALLKACQLVWQRNNNFELWAAPGLSVAGSFPFLKNLGPLDSASLSQAMSQCCGLVLCSLYEGDGIVWREAQAMGLPLVVSDLTAIREGVGNYHSVSFIDPNHIESIVNGIISAIEPNDDRRFNNPQSRIRSWDQVAEEYESFYRELSIQFQGFPRAKA